MSDERRRGQDADEENAPPAAPTVPPLPDTPVLKPNLPPRPPRRDEEASDYQQMGLAYTIPASLIAPIVVLTLAGAWLDARLKTSPYCTLVGALLGMVTGFINMIRIANKLNR